MYTITPNSRRAQTESETLLSSLELAVQLLTVIRKENLAIYDYRPSITFEKDSCGVEQLIVSYAYKYNSITPGVYPAFIYIQKNTSKDITGAINQIIIELREYERDKKQNNETPAHRT